jgi:hypothetical protein
MKQTLCNIIIAFIGLIIIYLILYFHQRSANEEIASVIRETMRAEFEYDRQTYKFIMEEYE